MSTNSLHNRWDRSRVLALASLLAAPLLMAILLRAVGKNPVSIFWAVIVSGFGSSSVYRSHYTDDTNFLVCFGGGYSSKSRAFQHGGEGQLHCGAIATTALVLYAPWLPHFMMIPFMILVAMVGGRCGG